MLLISHMKINFEFEVRQDLENWGPDLQWNSGQDYQIRVRRLKPYAGYFHFHKLSRLSMNYVKTYKLAVIIK